MKCRNLIALFFIALFFSACRNSGGDEMQNIDQILDFFIQDTNGNDLLIPNDSMGYYGRIELFDLNDERINQPISSGITYGIDSTSSKNYIQYIAGAKRILVDSSSPQNKTYQSDFMITLKKGFSQAIADSDTVHIVYTWTPDLFQVSQVKYNNDLVFSKIQGQKNKIVITK
ncbi:hypothetical protein [Elizabethkingia sp. JS20170427COW]|uniref:hypothetical protein n=1 Tax=Elizabethkingia sp. JS20170427COW TaxID=2583851 RepID=UPI001110A6BE|nr:hypothetical protein [Elizabethkingia sp. JS20170427COW]QCX53212.1 hypothetical protein FGE20_05460 [Elizabethkingia sp. JS20170427COW]